MTGSGSGESPDDPDRTDRDSAVPSDGSEREGSAREPEPGPSPDADSTADRDAFGESDGSRPRDGSADRPSDDESVVRGPAGGRPNGGRARGADDRVTIEDDGVVRWFLKTNDGTVVVVRDLLTSVAIVAVIGLLLFAVSGMWPPLVAIESESMEPNMYKGDLVFVVDENRYAGDGAVDGTGVVPYTEGADTEHSKFGNPGDVIIFAPDGDDRRTPVIHRAHYWVEEGEDWVADADRTRLNGRTCDDLTSCPAPHDGFITMGDGNPGYDQAEMGANTNVVKPEWIAGKGMFRIPWLGHIRLTFDELFFVGPTPGGPGAIPVFVGAVAAGGVLAGVDPRRR